MAHLNMRNNVPSMRRARNASGVARSQAAASHIRSVRARSASEPAPAVVEAAPAPPRVRVAVQEAGAYSVKGSVRKVNEDRWDTKMDADTGAIGQPVAYAGVYDGHGGSATAEWLQERLFNVIRSKWSPGGARGGDYTALVNDAFLEADKQLLSNTSGFMGMGERGVGGAKCGATAAAVMLVPEASGTTSLVTANVGDARILLVRGGKPVQLSEDHVPDVEAERKRIEQYNPNPKMPLVRFVGGTWRVGGLLALSRAFGDAYMKGNLQFEGISQSFDRTSSYSSGFGVVAEPFTTQTTLQADDTYVVVASDGLFSEEARGGGGGLDNEGVCQALVKAASSGASCTQLAEQLAAEAARIGSTDDITLVVIRLGAAA